MSVEKSQSVDSEQEVVFPSAELVAAREKEGLTQKDVARELRLSDKYIDALERAAFEELPSMVFARGYIRSYTKLMHLDMDRYLDLFDELYGGGIRRPAAMHSASGIERQAKLGDPVIKWSAWLFIIAVIAASFWWWKTQQTDVQQSAELSTVQPVEIESVDGSTVVVEPRPVVDLQAAVTEPEADTGTSDSEAGVIASESEEQAAETVVSESVEQISEAVNEVVTEEQTEAATVAEAVVESAVTEAVTVPVAAGPVGSLRVTFVDECWVSVEDQAGEVLAMRVKPAGSELNVSGATPLKVLLGKASAVDKVFYNGEPVDINRSSRSGVVRLSLPASE